MFITKLNYSSDILSMSEEYNNILNICGWGSKNQIGLNSRTGAENKWHDAAGSLYDHVNKIFTSLESDYCEWNIPNTNYIRNQIELLQTFENTGIGRCRFMRLLPKTGLSVHKDTEVRYHYVLKTNPKAYISMNNTNSEDNTVTPRGQFYHIPLDGYWYRVDTRQIHWVYNGGDTERVHLVVCGT